MAQLRRYPESPPESPSRVPHSEPDDRRSAGAEELLALLGDEYTYRVLEAVVEQPRTGREIMDAADVSKATVYRRLEKLEDAGLVASTMRLAADGSHCKQFHATVTALQVRFDEDGFTASIESTDGPSRRGQPLTADD